MSSSWGEPRRRVVEWFDPAVSAASLPGQSGLEFLSSILDGELPLPPIGASLRFRPVAVEWGRVTFQCDLDTSLYNPIGSVHGGVMCTLLDTVVGCAVHSTLDAGLGYTSIDLNVSYLRPATTESGTLVATGEVTKPGRRVAFAAGEVVGADGRTVATATGSCLVFPLS